MKKYLIYWDNTKGIEGNSILEFDPKTVTLIQMVSKLTSTLRRDFSEELNGKPLGTLLIKFMVEMK